MEIENQVIYLVLKPNNLMSELSINDWNEFISFYENDDESIVEDYDENFDGYVFITTNLFNILKKRSIMDLRFNYGKRTANHKTDYNLI